MKKIIISIFCLLPLFLNANKLFSDIDIDFKNLQTIVGTYDVDRAIIMKGNDIFIDNANLESFRGQMVISLSHDNNIIRSTLKAQYDDDLFSDEKYAPYEFIFLDRSIDINKNTSLKDNTNESKLSAIGMHYYNEQKSLIWEIPFEDNKNLILVLKKSSDSIKRLSDRPYSLL